jgi:hypothetical protein
MKRLVADTGPILHLHEAGALQPLPLIGKVFPLPMVIAELRAHSPSLWISQKVRTQARAALEKLFATK